MAGLDGEGRRDLLLVGLFSAVYMRWVGWICCPSESLVRLEVDAK